MCKSQEVEVMYLPIRDFEFKGNGDAEYKNRLHCSTSNDLCMPSSELNVDEIYGSDDG